MEGLLKKKRFLLAQNFEPKRISKPNFAAAKKKVCCSCRWWSTSSPRCVSKVWSWWWKSRNGSSLVCLTPCCCCCSNGKQEEWWQSSNPRIPQKKLLWGIFFCPLSHATRQTRRRAVQQSLALFLSLILFDSTYTSAFFFLLLLFACGVICVSIPKQQSELF